MRRLWPVLAVVLVVLALGGGGVVMLTRNERRERTRAALRAAGERYAAQAQKDPRTFADWMEALGEQETRLDYTQTNLTGPDGARGGSYGATQISAKTARGFGYQGPMERLIEDPDFAADLTAQMVVQGYAERNGNDYYFGPPDSFAEMAAVWNAGRTSVDPELPASTRDDYIPSAQAFLAGIQGTGVA